MAKKSGGYTLATVHSGTLRVMLEGIGHFPTKLPNMHLAGHAAYAWVCLRARTFTGVAEECFELLEYDPKENTARFKVNEDKIEKIRTKPVQASPNMLQM